MIFQVLSSVFLFLCSASFAVLVFRLVVPNKGYSSLDQSPDEKPLVALDTDRYIRYLISLYKAIQHLNKTHTHSKKKKEKLASLLVL